MSSNSEEFGRYIAEAWLTAQKQGAVGGSGSGGRRGGRGGGGGRGGLQKNTAPRCHRCRSSEHLIANCPHKGESRRKVRQRLREAASAQETRPAPAEQPVLLPPPSPPLPPPAAPVAPIAPAAAPAEQPTVSFAMPRDGPQYLPSPPPAAEPQTGRPPARLGWTVQWSPKWNRWYYVHYLDSSVEWYEQQ